MTAQDAAASPAGSASATPLPDHLPAKGNTENTATLDPATASALGESSSTPAPWGTVCLAVLTQRCSDKAPSVRAKALSHLAGVISHWLEDKRGNGDSERAKGQFRQVVCA